jgi:hypothetical protein
MKSACGRRDERVTMPRTRANATKASLIFRLEESRTSALESQILDDPIQPPVPLAHSHMCSFSELCFWGDDQYHKPGVKGVYGRFVNCGRKILSSWRLKFPQFWQVKVSEVEESDRRFVHSQDWDQGSRSPHLVCLPTHCVSPAGKRQVVISACTADISAVRLPHDVRCSDFVTKRVFTLTRATLWYFLHGIINLPPFCSVCDRHSRVVWPRDECLGSCQSTKASQVREIT